MRRLKPINKLDVMGHLCLPLEKMFDEFGESKLNKKQNTNGTNYNLSVKGGGIEFVFIENNREHKALLNLQTNLLDHAKRQSIIDADRTIQLRADLDKLREGFININMFMQEFDEKKKRALETVNDEKLLHIQIKDDITRLTESIAVMKEFRDVLANVVKHLEPYERVIEEAVALNDNWTTTQDCMHKCDGILMAQNEILKMEDKTILQIEVIRQEMARATSKAASEILGLDITLNDLQKTLDAAREQCKRWERTLVDVKKCILNNELMKHRITRAVDGLYRMLCRRRSIQPGPISNISDQLEFIREEFLVLKKVVDECKKTSETASKRPSFRLKRPPKF